MQPSIPEALLLEAVKTWDTPLFIYDMDTIERKINSVKSNFSVEDLEIRFACKALTNGKILQLMGSNNCGIDTVSIEECQIALKAGIPASKISFTPSGVRFEEYAFAINNGIRIHVDQFYVLEWLEKNHPGTEITLRFNPGIRAGDNVKLQVGADDSKFGIQPSQWEDFDNFIQNSSLVVTGVHLHMGSDIKEIDSYKEAMHFLLSKAELFLETLHHIDIGGGWKVPYHPEDAGLDIESFGKWISEAFNNFCKKTEAKLSLTVEPGKYLVSESGYLLMEVTGIRTEQGGTLAYVNSGFNHFIRPMYYDAYHQIHNLSNPMGEQRLYSIAGYLCETDNFALSRWVSEIRKGDILCLYNAGAYGFTMSSQYNSRVRPPEVGRQGNQLHLLRRRETLEDIIRTDEFLS